MKLNTSTSILKLGLSAMVALAAMLIALCLAFPATAMAEESASGSSAQGDEKLQQLQNAYETAQADYEAAVQASEKADQAVAETQAALTAAESALETAKTNASNFAQLEKAATDAAQAAVEPTATAKAARDEATVIAELLDNFKNASENLKQKMDEGDRVNPLDLQEAQAKYDGAKAQVLNKFIDFEESWDAATIDGELAKKSAEANNNADNAEAEAKTLQDKAAAAQQALDESKQKIAEELGIAADEVTKERLDQNVSDAEATVQSLKKKLEAAENAAQEAAQAAKDAEAARDAAKDAYETYKAEYDAQKKKDNNKADDNKDKSNKDKSNKDKSNKDKSNTGTKGKAAKSTAATGDKEDAVVIILLSIMMVALVALEIARRHS